MGQDTGSGFHTPVLAKEVARLFASVTGGVIVDATYGGGGHARRLLDEVNENVQVLAIDRDPEAVERSHNSDRLTVVEGNFRNLAEILDSAGIQHIDGALFDLGVSSHQLDEADRGFSYRREGPLSMAMGQDSSVSAEEIVNEWDEAALEQLIRRLGEDRNSRRIARSITEHRPISTTLELADAVASAVPGNTRRAHPARRTFQAIRMEVNKELEALAEGLDAAIDALSPRAICVVISYHSLEDGVVRDRFADGVGSCTCPPDLPVCGCGAEATLRWVQKRPLRPGDDEVAENPRARSARLRAAERLAS